MSDEALDNITDKHREFLSTFGNALSDCEWTDNAIGDCIKSVAAEVGIGGRESYIAIYWALLGQDYGPRASSLIAEMDREALLEILRVL